MYTVYVLFSRQFEKVYTGHTSDLVKRFHFHNTYGRQKGTWPFRPWEVVYTAHFEDKQLALRYEWLLKSGKGRAWLWNRIREEYYRDGYISGVVPE
ncbi:GIY-YIG nuclease family protein [Chitinophaga pinensis]|uniref:Excinuclease ABC C subunit domain protein n=1 Tax=Chitinophaga pinensis (strain ATCC 43595 / DSM 2588 / LMG 13176 / NBRC 15968 / NCIMB 11800 / UQM 2034) TaxID=485918 RepID=A0A979GS09_CHIPD|nr:GIY-YIG nuclease family protein [Chitinophaga pinensis]ACU59089.1 Excinuclease ABC C subunit domain protein [Chitinophaga pinensis DSM 2588]